MRLDKPRVLPAPEAEWDETFRPIADQPAARVDGTVMNLLTTMARHPRLLKRWLLFGNYLLASSSLAPRERELAILRTGLRARSAYEWAQHVSMARTAGCSDDDIERVIAGPDASGWTELERALLRATDDLVADQFVTDADWQVLSKYWTEQQRIDFVFTVGQYVLVSTVLNTFGVQLEPGVERFPAELFRTGVFGS